MAKAMFLINTIIMTLMLDYIEGTRSRGRQRITFLDSLSSFVTGNNKDNIALLRMTEDRDRWRIMIADVCSRQGI